MLPHNVCYEWQSASGSDIGEPTRSSAADRSGGPRWWNALPTEVSNGTIQCCVMNEDCNENADLPGPWRSM